MPELLLEVGCEELPATFVRKAYTELGERVSAMLTEAGVMGSTPNVRLLGTPRRLIVGIGDLAARQEDTTKESRGPGVKAAYDASGNPTPALLGFCRGQGVDPADVRNDGQYVWATKHVPGEDTAKLLAEILPKAIRALTFEKSMRWGSTRMRFARPIRWILATFDGGPVAFDIEGVASGVQSHGHRFYSPEPFEARTFDDLIAGLRARKVEPDPSVRRQRIESGARDVAGGTPDLPEALVEENTFLTEWPTPIVGEFRPEFRELPDPVLITAMAKHEKMFPVRDAEGELTNRFVFVRNSGEDASVRKGCEWVLNARFNDAKFFHDEDQRQSLTEFLDRTGGILFQQRLGTVRQRADRLAALAEAIARATDANDEETEFARQAGLYAKADLATGLVGELASLQGIIGGEYAAREGMPEPVAWAVATQYDLGKNPEPNDAKGRTAVRLVMADQLDKLAGYLGIGLQPSGSSDPYALRRAASLLIEAAWNWPAPLPSYEGLFDVALSLYADQGVDLDADAARAALFDVFASRYGVAMPGVRYDVLEAAILSPTSPETVRPQGVRFRARLLSALAEDVPFVQTATRPLNIVMAARRKGEEIGFDDPLHRLEHAALESADGLELLQTLADNAEPLAAAANAERDDEVLQRLKSLEAPINQFFETTMVMADQPEVRYARLTLMHATSLQLLTAGDFSKLVIEG